MSLSKTEAAQLHHLAKAFRGAAANAGVVEHLAGLLDAWVEEHLARPRDAGDERQRELFDEPAPAPCSAPAVAVGADLRAEVEALRSQLEARRERDAARKRKDRGQPGGEKITPCPRTSADASADTPQMSADADASRAIPQASAIDLSADALSHDHDHDLKRSRSHDHGARAWTLDGEHPPEWAYDDWRDLRPDLVEYEFRGVLWPRFATRRHRSEADARDHFRRWLKRHRPESTVPQTGRQFRKPADENAQSQLPSHEVEEPETPDDELGEDHPPLPATERSRLLALLPPLAATGPRDLLAELARLEEDSTGPPSKAPAVA